MLQGFMVKSRVLRGAPARAVFALCGAALGAWVALAPPPPAFSPSTVATPPPAVATEAALNAAADRACLAQRQALWGLPATPIPALNHPALRAQVLGRAKAEPVLFLQRPKPEAGSEQARALRAELERAPDYATFDRVVGKVRTSPELARAVFLSDGYLYTELPELAVMFAALTLPMLFLDPEIVILRGRDTLAARRLPDGDYEYTTGAEQGKRAKLLLFDRVAPATAALRPARHVDVRKLASELGFDELEVLRISGSSLAVDLVYAQKRVPALLRVEQGEVSLSCEAAGSALSHVLSRRAESQRAAQVHARLLAVVAEQVDEGLPFDEPKTEDGQQDGLLRPEWRSAYLSGSSSFEFNGDRYAVFDSTGRPRPPQVCIDFVLDTLERASGTWWQSRSQPRRRVLGQLRFEESAIENRRSVERFIDFTREPQEWFELYELPPEKQVPFRERQRFFSEIYSQRDRFRKGDIVAILGPRDDGKLHYHSFFVVDADPVSGMPTQLAANAGRPRIRSWEGEMSNAPRRSIRARIRPRQVWLESFLQHGGAVSVDEPARLTPGLRSPPTAPTPVLHPAEVAPAAG